MMLKKLGIFWLIDPIDGTKEFIDKGDDFTINIALCQFNKPIFRICMRLQDLVIFIEKI